MAATGNKTTAIVSDLNVDPKTLRKPQRRKAALDKYQRLEERVRDLSKQRDLAKNEALSLGEHGKTYVATDGTTFLFVDTELEIRKHEKVVQALAERYGVTPAQLDAEYAKTMGKRAERKIKKV